MANPAVHRLRLLGTALLFSTGGAAIKATSLTAWQVACLRSALAALVLTLALGAVRGLFRPRILLVAGAYAATMIFYVSANKLTTAANTIFLQSTAPLYLLLLGPWLLRERLRPRDLLFGLGLALGMALFFVGLEQPRVSAPDPARGNVLGALAGLSWAWTILGLRWLGRGADGSAGDPALRAVISGNLVAALVCLPLALPLAAGPRDWGVVAYLGAFQIGLAYVWMTRSVRHVPALEISLLLLLEPVLSVLWAWLLHGEWPGPFSLAGCVVILGATVAHTLRRPEPSNPPHRGA